MATAKKAKVLPTFGTDPEFFLSSKGRIVTSCGKFGGTKEKPRSYIDSGVTYHEDNVCLEFGIEPANDYYVACDRLNNLVYYADKLARSKRCTISFKKSQHKFTDTQLMSKKAREFGCNVDFDAYTGKQDPRLDLPDFGNWRFAGGHIHLGGEFNCPRFVAVIILEAMLSMTLDSIKGDYKLANNKRMEWYGKPGIYRPKPYGIEYRTPSNAWMGLEKARQDIVYKTLRAGHLLINWKPKRIKELLDDIPILELQEYVSSPVTLGKNDEIISVLQRHEAYV
jgi:hypothetical protein